MLKLYGTVVVAAVLLLSGCDRGEATLTLTGEERAAAQRGRDAIAARNCAACHTIPGIEDADGVVGPPLTSYSQRPYVAGNTTMPNTHENLVRWLMDPPSIEPDTDMPDLGLKREEASDIATYLRAIGGPPPDLPPPSPPPPSPEEG